MESLEGLLKTYKQEDLIKEILYLSKDNPNICEHFIKKQSFHKQEKTLNNVNFKITKNMAFRFMYSGKNYDGLVTQKDTKNTIEEHIFAALKKAKLIEDENSCNFARCGRTDAGVSSV